MLLQFAGKRYCLLPANFAGKRYCLQPVNFPGKWYCLVPVNYRRSLSGATPLDSIAGPRLLRNNKGMYGYVISFSVSVEHHQ